MQKSEAPKMAERLRVLAQDSPFNALKRKTVDGTLSIGGAEYPRDGATPRGLGDAADKAMYISKQGGRNRVSGARGGRTPAPRVHELLGGSPCPKWVGRSIPAASERLPR